MKDLRGKRPIDTYPFLVTIEDGYLYNGTGSAVINVNITASQAISASYEIIYETSSSYAETASLAGTSSFAITSSFSRTSSFSISSSWASSAILASSSSYAVTLIVRDGASIGGMSEGVTSTNTVQIGTGDAPPTTNKKTDGAVQVGWGAGNNSATASNAVQIGIQAGVNTTIANYAVQVGALAGANTSTASNAVQIGVSAGQNAVDATDAVQIGNSVGGGSTTATNAVQVGAFTGQYSTNATNATQVGSFAGNQAKTGSYTTFVGSYADTLNANLNVERSIAIGYNAKVSSSNTCVIGGAAGGADAVKVTIGGTTAVNILDIYGNISCSVITASIYAPNTMVIPVISGSPVLTPTKGLMTFDSSSNLLYVYNGTSWRSSSFA